MTFELQIKAALAGVLAISCALTATAQDAGHLDQESAARLFPAKRSYSPYADRNFPSRPYFGDTHLHSATRGISSGLSLGIHSEPVIVTGAGESLA